MKCSYCPNMVVSGSGMELSFWSLGFQDIRYACSDCVKRVFGKSATEVTINCLPKAFDMLFTREPENTTR